MNCEICGKEVEKDEFYVEVWDHGTYHECICEDCAKDFCDKAKNDSGVEVEDPKNHNDTCHKCWFCEEVRDESDMVLEGENGTEDWLCKDCLNSLISRGEPVHVHYNH